MQQVLGSGVLDWDLDGSLAKPFKVENVAAGLVDVDLVLLEHLEDSGVSVDSEA